MHHIGSATHSSTHVHVDTHSHRESPRETIAAMPSDAFLLESITERWGLQSPPLVSPSG